jgi:hypothetical protein
MRRQSFKAAADDDSLPVMVPRNDKAAVPISPERVRRLRKHLVAPCGHCVRRRILSIPFRLYGRNRRVLLPTWRAPPVLCARDGAAETVSIMPFWMKGRWRECAAQGGSWVCARCCGYMSSECRRLGTRIRAYFTENKVVHWTGRCNFKPSLKVTTRDLGDTVEVQVRDNGVGIAPEIKDKLFQPFFTTKPTGEGTGLGLSISYDIVTQEHGGTITVDSKVGEFTEFTVRLPRS